MTRIKSIGFTWLLPVLAGFAAIWLLLMAGNKFRIESWMLRYSLVNALLLVLGASVISTILRYYRPGGFQIVNLGIWILIFAAGITFLSEWILNGIGDVPAAWTNEIRPIRLAMAMLLLLCVALISWVNRQRKSELNTVHRYNEMHQLSRDAELNSLRQQLQPHFLFNSLNSIQVLIGSDPEKARKMVVQLSDYLRSTLKKNNESKHGILEELENSLLYLEIEKIRFGDRLKVETNLSDETILKERQVPAMVLQPLVENAVKHGIYQTSGPVTIQLSLKADEQFTYIQISNPFDPEAVQESKGAGFGLSSLKRRMFLLYGSHAEVSTQTHDHQFVAELKIPVS